MGSDMHMCWYWEHPFKGLVFTVIKIKEDGTVGRFELPVEKKERINQVLLERALSTTPG